MNISTIPKPKQSLLSIIIIVVSDSKHLEVCLNALSQQENPPKMEIIVPFDGRRKDIPLLITRFPNVHFHCIDTFTNNGPIGLCHEHFDEMRSIGIRLAHGDIISLMEDHNKPCKTWAFNVAEAHKSSKDVIGGVVENGVDLPLNWSVYFCDFGRYQKPVINGPSHFLSDINISFKSNILKSIRHVWEISFHEPEVIKAMLDQNVTLWISSEIVVYQHRINLDLYSLLRERFIWGRYFAGNRVQRFSAKKRILYSSLSPVLPFFLLMKKLSDVLVKRRLIGTYMKVLPITFLLLVFWSYGEFVGYLTARPSNYIKQ